MIQFAHPHVLWLLAALPLLFVFARRGPRAALRVSSIEPMREAAKATRARLGVLLPALRFLVLALVIVALARPQLAHSETTTETSGVDVMLAVDVSESMSALDLELGDEQASRLDVVKSVVAKFIEGRASDRLGIVAFAGAPYLVSPLTLDHDWLRQNLARLRIGLIAQDGTAVGDALAAATKRLQDKDAKSRVVVLVTDGASNTGKIPPLLAAEAARSLGVRVYTIGVGAEGEAPMPVVGRDGRTRIVMAQADVDEDTLRTIADTTGGKFYRATDTAALERIYGEINEMEQTIHEARTVVRADEKFAWAAVPAFLLLAAELGLAHTILRRVP